MPRHSVAVGSTEERPRPPDANLPNDTAARSLKMHVLLGGLILTLLVGAVNVTLQAFVLGPIRAMRSHVVDLEHGRWRGQQPPASTTRSAPSMPTSIASAQNWMR